MFNGCAIPLRAPAPVENHYPSTSLSACGAAGGMTEAEALLPVTSKTDLIKDIDDAIDEIGFGKTQAFLFSAMGLSYMADAMEVTLLSFLYSCLVDFWDLSDYQGDLIVSCVFAGELIGALLAGPLADRFGRRVVSIGSTFLCGVAGMCSALADNVLIFILFRTLTGVGIGMFCVPFDLVGEFMPSSTRGLILSIYQYWWCIGSMYTVLMAWLVLPSWRALVILCAAPVLVAGVCMVFIPESPRWLLAQGRNQEAQRILTDMAKSNRPQKPVPNIQLERTLLKDEHGSVSSLFENPDLRRYTLANMVIWASAGFTFYGNPVPCQPAQVVSVCVQHFMTLPLVPVPPPAAILPSHQACSSC